MANLYIIGGANGSGKTTVSLNMLPSLLGVFEYVNADIRRRYERGRTNLLNLYLPLCDGWMVFDNSGSAPQLIAEAIIGERPIIYSQETWEKICGGFYG